jgi:hypothetical protein
MLIQKLARCDSIVAPQQPPADFCNNIGPGLKPRAPAMAAGFWGTPAAPAARWLGGL